MKRRSFLSTLFFAITLLLCLCGCGQSGTEKIWKGMIKTEEGMATMEKLCQIEPDWTQEQIKELMGSYGKDSGFSSVRESFYDVEEGKVARVITHYIDGHDSVEVQLIDTATSESVTVVGKTSLPSEHYVPSTPQTYPFLPK